MIRGNILRGEPTVKPSPSKHCQQLGLKSPAKQREKIMDILITLPDNSIKRVNVMFNVNDGYAEIFLPKKEYFIKESGDEISSDFICECIEYAINEGLTSSDWEESKFSFKEVK